VTYLLFGLLIVLAFVIVWDYRGQAERPSITAEEQTLFFRWHKAGILIFITGSIISLSYVLWGTSDSGLSDMVTSDRTTYLWGAACAMALAYVHFRAIREPYRNRATRFVNWYASQRFFQVVPVDPRKQILVIGVICFIIGAASFVLFLTGIPASWQRVRP
jgi:hypothetical protein